MAYGTNDASRNAAVEQVTATTNPQGGVVALAPVVVPVGEDGLTKATAINPVPVRPFGSDDTGTGQVSVGTTATVIRIGSAKDVEVTLVNHGTTDVFIGKSNVTTANGFLLQGVKGEKITLRTRGTLYGIVGAGTQTVGYFAAFDN